MRGRHQSRTIRRIIGVFGACAIAAAGVPAAAQGVARAGQPVACESLASLALPDAKVTRAERVSAGAFTAPVPPPIPVPADYSRLPAFCRVAATISPTPDSAIKMEIWMPVEGWNGKFVGVGDGGFGGAIWYFAMVDPLSRGYAVAATDTGHESRDGADASFAIGHPEKLVDYAWRAVHEMTLKSKAIIAQHYGTTANRSYWVGCSSGGRQGLKEAQRFPGDYDAISAGAPATNWVPLMAHAANVQRLITDTTVGIPQAGLNLLKAAAIAACDARDGVTDRVVEDPHGCTFDPGTLLCSAGSSTNCLTAQQVDTARSIYAGVANPRTRETIMPGPAPGSEPAWSAFSPKAFPIGANYWRDLVMGNPNWSLASLDLDADVARARKLDGAELATANADLRPFFARGGKLLLWHGWTDGLIPAQNTIDYYMSVLGTTGPDANASMRLFMLPGVDHCAGGEGTFMMDALGVLDGWVENKQPPARIVASRPLPGGTLRTRPLCPYPQVARYRGQGSTDDERNFECSAPAAR